MGRFLSRTQCFLVRTPQEVREGGSLARGILQENRTQQTRRSLLYIDHQRSSCSSEWVHLSHFSDLSPSPVGCEVQVGHLGRDA